MIPTIEDDPRELELISNLDAILREPGIGEHLHRLKVAVTATVNSGESFESKSVPISIFDGKLPDVCKSCRIFAISKRKEFPKERHLNSHQRVCSLEGEGEMLIYHADSATTVRLADDLSLPVRNRWVSVPRTTWHRIIANSSIWVGIAFHTVPLEMLIDEHLPA